MTWTAPWEASENPHQPLFSPVTLITPRSCLFTKGGLPTGCDSVFVSPALRCLVIDQCAVNVDWMNELWMGLAGCPEVAHLLRLGDCLPMRLRCCGCSLHWSRDLYSNPSVVPDIQAHGLGWYCVSWMVLCVSTAISFSKSPIVVRVQMECMRRQGAPGRQNDGCWAFKLGSWSHDLLLPLLLLGKGGTLRASGLPSFVVQSLRHVWLYATPRTAECQASLSSTTSRSLLKFIFSESVMLSNHLILWLLCPPWKCFSWRGGSALLTASGRQEADVQRCLESGWTHLTLAEAGLQEVLNLPPTVNI